MRIAFWWLIVLANLGCRRHDVAIESTAMPAEAPARSRMLHVGDVTLRITSVGNPRAPILLVLHDGPGLDHTYLRPWLDALGAQSQLLYVDLRGHGRSTLPADASGFTVAAAAGDIADLIVTLADNTPVDVLGHGFGAAVAIELAARHPERVRRLVLVDPLRDAHQLETLPDRMRQTLGETGWQHLVALETAQGTLRDVRSPTEFFRRLGRAWWHARPSDSTFERMGRDMFYRGETDAAFRVELSGWDARQLAGDVRAPTLVLSGDDDQTYLASDSRAFADVLPHGTYDEVPAAGHCPFIEQNSRFIASVDRFVRGTAEPRVVY